MPQLKHPANAKRRRISARLTAASYDMAATMSSITGQSISAILEQSIASYHQTVLASRRHPWLLLKETGLINVGRGGRNLSSTYKFALTESLLKKRRVGK